MQSTHLLRRRPAHLAFGPQQRQLIVKVMLFTGRQKQCARKVMPAAAAIGQQICDQSRAQGQVIRADSFLLTEMASLGQVGGVSTYLNPRESAVRQCKCTFFGSQRKFPLRQRNHSVTCAYLAHCLRSEQSDVAFLAHQCQPPAWRAAAAVDLSATALSLRRCHLEQNRCVGRFKEKRCSTSRQRYLPGKWTDSALLMIISPPRWRRWYLP